MGVALPADSRQLSLLVVGLWVNHQVCLAQHPSADLALPPTSMYFPGPILLGKSRGGLLDSGAVLGEHGAIERDMSWTLAQSKQTTGAIDMATPCPAILTFASLLQETLSR